MFILYLGAKLLQLTFLLIALAILVFGLYETAASTWFYAKGAPVEGRVVGVSGESPFRFPRISYEWPPSSGTITRIEHFVPRDDLERGDHVTVRVLADDHGIARPDKSLIGHALAAGALVCGLALSFAVYSVWYAPNAFFGRLPLEQDHATLGSLAAWRVGLLLLGPPVAVLAFYGYYLPWMRLSEYPSLFDPRGVMQLAEERGGAPVDSPLNEYERGLLALPFGLGTGAAHDGFERAFRFRRRNPDRYERYLRALGDPEIGFPIDMRRVAWLLMEQTPLTELDRFLASGVRLSLRDRNILLQIANQQTDARKPAVFEILAKHGISAERPVHER